MANSTTATPADGAAPAPKPAPARPGAPPPLTGGKLILGTIALSAKASAWVIAGVGALLSTSVLLDYAGFPIPVAQGIGLAVAVLVARWRLTGHLGRLNWPFPAE